MLPSRSVSQERSPAQVYDELFVPALFEQWGEVMVEAAGVGTGQRVLDVGCGTGVLACAAAAHVGPGGAVTGLDVNEDMLAVARGKRARVEWTSGRAESLPMPDAHFDRVVSQFVLMFFEDRVAALGEMMRVLAARGRLAIAVCDALDHSAGYAAFAELLHRLFGREVADAFRAPFVLGDRAHLRSLCADAGIEEVEVTRRDGTVRFDSIGSLVATEGACVWTLGGMLDPEQLDRLREQAEESLRPFLTSTGRLEFVMPTLIVTARKH